MKKRKFIKSFGNALMLSPFFSFDLENHDYDLYSDRTLLNDDEFWKRIRKDYSLKKDYINLENGYYNIIPNPTLKKFIEHVKTVNFEGSYYMRTKRTIDNRRVAGRLAKLVGCSDDELVITRNTTESLDLIIGGFRWNKGDEAIYATQDYGAMQQMFKLVSKRYGILNKIVSIPNHPISDEQIVSIYEDQITPKTKLIMVSHMINITGHILPVRKICDMAHKYGVEKLLAELLPVIDNLEHALNNLSENATKEDKEGIELTLKSFESALDKFGMIPIYPVNEDFNPEKHEAVTMEKDESKENGSIGNIFQRGWELHSRLVRPARVTVIKN